jgi:hypothetical protein
MGLAYNPKNRANDFQVQYVVKTTGDQWFNVTTGYGDNANSGTSAQRVVQNDILAGDTADGSPAAAELVAS